MGMPKDNCCIAHVLSSRLSDSLSHTHTRGTVTTWPRVRKTKGSSRWTRDAGGQETRDKKRFPFTPTRDPHEGGGLTVLYIPHTYSPPSYPHTTEPHGVREEIKVSLVASF